jgi:syntaxin 16
MATRRKTKRFVKLREKFKRQRAKEASYSSRGGGGGDGGNPFDSLREMDSISSTTVGNDSNDNSSSDSHVISFDQAKHTLPPYWVDNVDETKTQMEDIRKRMDSLDRVCRRRLMAFNDREERRLEEEINTLVRMITDLFKRTEKSLKRIFSAQIVQGDRDSDVRKNIQRALATDLQNLSFDFRKRQKEYLQKIQGKKKDTAGEGFFVPSEEDVKNSKRASGFNDRQIDMIQDIQEGLDQRDQEIMHIAKSINELSQIFKELAVLVIDQGTVLDRIDYNMEQVEDKVEQGLGELEKAREMSKKAGPLKCVVFLIILNAVLILVLYMKHRS